MRFSLAAFPDSEAGTLRLVGLMKSIANREKMYPIVRLQAVDIIRGTMPRDITAQIVALRGWLADHVQFLRDPTKAELIQTPTYLIRGIKKDWVAFGDCDDIALLGATLALSIGLRCRFMLVAFAPTAPFTHIWTEVASPYDHRWYDLDTSRSAQDLERSPIARFRAVPL